MARGDAEFCRWETGFVLDDPRYVMLGEVEKAIYQHCWASAVRERTQRPGSLERPEFVARAANISRQPERLPDGSLKTGAKGVVLWVNPDQLVRNAYRKMSKPPHKLLNVLERRDGSVRVTVLGARRKHPKLHRWKDAR